MDIKKFIFILIIILFNDSHSASLEKQNSELKQQVDGLKAENEKLRSSLNFYSELYDNPYANEGYDQNGKYINKIYIPRFTNSMCTNIITSNYSKSKCSIKKQINIQITFDEESSTEGFVNDCYVAAIPLAYFINQNGHLKKHDDKIILGNREYILVDENDSLSKWYRKYQESIFCTIL